MSLCGQLEDLCISIPSIPYPSQESSSTTPWIGFFQPVLKWNLISLLQRSERVDDAQTSGPSLVQEIKSHCLPTAAILTSHDPPHSWAFCSHLPHDLIVILIGIQPAIAIEVIFVLIESIHQSHLQWGGLEVSRWDCWLSHPWPGVLILLS